MLKTMNDSRAESEKARFREILRKRYQIVKTLVQTHAKHPVLKALPFNSGYFMSFRCNGVPAETIRQALLKDHGIGTIALGNRYLRIAFSSIEAEHIPFVYETLYKVAEELA